MSLGLVVHRNDSGNRRQEGQFTADLASLFERRRIALGDTHVCEQFEILFTTSEAFRSQLFTLCTAISHMAEADLTGEELLHLIARALRSASGDIPESLRRRFLAGLEEWSHRGLSTEDEWPPRKKAAASTEEGVYPPEAWASAVSIESELMQAAEPAPEAAIARPAGVRTLQEALELARVRGGDRPLRPEAVAPEATPVTAHDPNSATLEELSTLLLQIEERMKRLRPQLVETGTPQVAGGVQRTPVQVTPFRPAVEDSVAGRPPSLEEREAAFLERHPYLRRDSGRTSVDYVADRMARQAEPVQVELLAAPAVAPAVEQGPPELQLVPRKGVEPEEIAPDPPRGASERQRFKTYLALAVLAGIGLVATPISGVLAYRYMHPMYIYQPAPVPPTDNQVQPAERTAKPTEKPARRSRATRPATRRPEVTVWPPDPHR